MLIQLSDKHNPKAPQLFTNEAKTLERRFGPGVEAMNRSISPVPGLAQVGVVETPFHPLLGAVDAAFRNHWDVELRPDDVWLAIAQGFGLHINKYPEELRKRFVAHEGQLTLKVRRDSFVKGSPDNDWEGAYAEFSTLIAEHIGAEKQRIFVNAFSTTGAPDKAASEVVLMGAMKSYFKYEMHTLCDIPAIHLAGTKADWQSVKDRSSALAEFHQDNAPLKWWIDVLLPILDRFVAAFDGNVDKEFWCSLYKVGGGSGGPYVTGWINVFFPYYDGGYNYRDKKHEIFAMDGVMTKLDKKGFGGLGGMMGGPTTDHFTSGLSRVPFEWHYLGQTFPMEFLGGFLTTNFKVVDGRTIIHPTIGWAVRDPSATPVIKKDRWGDEEG